MIMDKLLTFELPNGEQWGVPVSIIARHRAEAHKDSFGGDVERSLAEDTLPLFEGNACEVEDWACDNMTWSDLEDEARRVGNGQTGKTMEKMWNEADYFEVAEGDAGGHGS